MANSVQETSSQLRALDIPYRNDLLVACTIELPEVIISHHTPLVPFHLKYPLVLSVKRDSLRAL